MGKKWKLIYSIYQNFEFDTRIIWKEGNLFKNFFNINITRRMWIFVVQW